MNRKHVPSVLVIHSFRRGVGRTSVAANLAGILVSQGLRVGLVDTDYHSPAIHLFFGLRNGQIPCTLNAFMSGKCDILQAALDVTAHLNAVSGRSSPAGRSVPAITAVAIPGKLIIVPASTDTREILETIRRPIDFDRFNEGLARLDQAHQLDFIILDTAAGLNEVTLPAIALSHALVVLLRPDQQEYQGTAVTIEVAQNLAIPKLLLALNDTPESLDLENALQQLQQNYHCDVGALLPHSDTLMALASASLLSIVAPEDPFVVQLHQLAARLTTARTTS